LNSAFGSSSSLSCKLQQESLLLQKTSLCFRINYRMSHVAKFTLADIPSGVGVATRLSVVGTKSRPE
jgi:hypothetical protein